MRGRERQFGGRILRALFYGSLVLMTMLPAFGQAGGAADGVTTPAFWKSPIARFEAYLAHPELAPPDLRERLQAVSDAAASAGSPAQASVHRAPIGNLFNADGDGLPQDEESVSVCEENPNIVLGGANDFRGLLDPDGNFTGWYYSNDGGATLANEGLLPPVDVNGRNTGSSGDPSMVAGSGCTLFAADLNAGSQSGIGVYRTTPAILDNCTPLGSTGGLTKPDCWPVRRSIAAAQPGHFLDKEWMDVGFSGTREWVWIAYSDLSNFNGSTGAERSGIVYAVRCTTDLVTCSKPEVISGQQTIAEYPDVTIGPDGRVYMTWTEFVGRSFTAPVERAWFAVAQPGSKVFSRPRLVIPDDPLALRGHPFGLLHANDFRLIGDVTTNTVKMVAGQPRVFMTWNSCQAEIMSTTCEEAQVLLTYSDDFGLTWSDPTVISAGGDNYFPTIDLDQTTGNIMVAFYTNRHDQLFHNRQDVELVTLDSAGVVVKRQRVSPVSNETEADPLLGGSFIGDYIEISASNGQVWVHYNSNQRSVAFLGDGLPVPQQDNYLEVIGE